MKQKSKPQRTCCGCRNVFNKQDLVRVVRTPEGDVKLDATGKLNGRGAYICRNTACLEKAFRTGALGRSLETEIPQDLYARLGQELERVEQ